MTREVSAITLALCLVLGASPVAQALEDRDSFCQELLSLTSTELATREFASAMLRAKAECYLSGDGGVPKDQKIAKDLLEQAANRGDKDAMHMLASMRLFWSDDLSEQQQGFNQLMDEYRSGSAFAAGKIGYAFHQGLAVDADDAKALEYYEIAAKGGMTRWQLILSRIYEKGLYGVRPDQEKAKRWREYWPKVHVETYECVLASSYADGLALEKNEKMAAYFSDKCDGQGTSGWDKWLEDRNAWLESERHSESE